MADASDPKYDRKITGISANRRVLVVRLPEEIEESAAASPTRGARLSRPAEE